MYTRIPFGVVHGRFQLPHKGHLQYLLAAFERADALLIGICTPRICTQAEADQTGFPCTQELNPFSYNERVDMISGMLAEAGITQERYSFCEFPSDYQNIPSQIPLGAVFFMSVTSKGDEAKCAYLQKIGFHPEIVYSLPEKSHYGQSRSIRQSIASGTQEWKEHVPPSIVSYVTTHDIATRLASLSKR